MSVLFNRLAGPDPNADRIIFWDDSAGGYAFLEAGSGLSIAGTTITASGAGGTVTSVATAGLATGGPITGTGTVTVTAATQAQMEAASDTATAVVPGRVQYHPGVAKCWGSIDQTGTQSLLTSHNITGISDGGIGITDVTIATDFSSANWVCTQGAQVMIGSSASVANFLNKAAGTISIYSYDTNSVVLDTDDIGFAGHGDFA